MLSNLSIPSHLIEADEEGGHWITTKGGGHIFIKDDNSTFESGGFKFDAGLSNLNVEVFRKDYPNVKPQIITLDKELLDKVTREYSDKMGSARMLSVASAKTVPPIIIGHGNKFNKTYILDGNHRVAIMASRGANKVLAYVVPSGKSK